MSGEAVFVVAWLVGVCALVDGIVFNDRGVGGVDALSWRGGAR